MWNRWQDPTTGRFLSEDPARDGNNWYAYVGNNPLTHTDPTGLIVLRGSDGVTYNTNYDGSHVWPTESRRVTSHMDPVSHPSGIDIGAKTPGVRGDAVVATVGGKVTTSGSPEWSPSGSSYVIVAGEDGLEHRYTHMDGIDVKEGEVIKQGQQLGEMDKVGAPGGVHLHYEVRQDNVQVNPEAVLPPASTPSQSLPSQRNLQATAPPPASSGKSGSSGESGGGEKTDSIICHELYLQGYMSEDIHAADEEFGYQVKSSFPVVVAGYQLLARPVVTEMRKSKVFSQQVYSLARPWFTEMAHWVDPSKPGDALGFLMMLIGLPLCATVGVLVSLDWLLLTTMVLLFVARGKRTLVKVQVRNGLLG